MPILVADQWNALREGIATNSDGKQEFTGKIVVTFFLDKLYKQYYTGLSKNVVVEQRNGDKFKKVTERDENGRYVTKFYKTLYEHQIAVDSVSKSTCGFNGWLIKLTAMDMVCLPKGRSETREEIMVVEASVTEDGETKKQESNENESKPKTKIVQVKTQPDELLEKIFTVKKSAEKSKTNDDSLLSRIMSGQPIGTKR